MGKLTLDQAINSISTHIQNCGESDNALALNAGGEQTTITRLKNRKIRNPSLGTLIPIANYLGIGLDELTGNSKGGAMGSNLDVRSIPEQQFEAALKVARAWSELPQEWQERIYHFVTTFEMFERSKALEVMVSKKQTNKAPMPKTSKP